MDSCPLGDIQNSSVVNRSFRSFLSQLEGIDFIGLFCLHDHEVKNPQKKYRHKNVATFVSLKMGIFQDIFSTDKPSIFIHTTKPEYYPGELVQGTVHLNVTTPADIDSIKILIDGSEETYFTVTKTYTTTINGKTTTRLREKPFEERRIFFVNVVDLFAAKSTLQPGVFVFPFQFMLNHNLPGSCSVESGSSRGSVRYNLFVQVVVPGFFKANLEHLQELRVIEPLKQILSATQTYKEENVTFLCCIPKGRVTLSANIDKNVYYPNETVELKLQVNNSESKVNLKACSLELIQTVVLRAKGEKKTFDVKIVKTKSPPVAAGEMCDRTIQMLLPPGLEASTTGSIMKCTYELNVRLSVPWSPDVTITQPVQILAAPMTNYALTIPYIPNQVMMPEVMMAPMVPQQKS